MTKVITRAEVKKNRSRRNLWLIIHDDVYDVTKFLEEHPGGEDTLLDAAGSDATQAFEDVGHSEDARELLKQYKIGSLPDDEKAKQPVPVQACCKRPRCPRNSKTCAKDCTSSNSCMIEHKKEKEMAKKDRKAKNSEPSSCQALKPPITKKIAKNWRTFDAPDNTSPLTAKSSRGTRFVVPPDKCDETPTSTSAAGKIVADCPHSPAVHKKAKKGFVCKV
ncbi:nitrate reductase [NADH] 1-like isoform X5 [Leguminivora glycinivorella]|uniref:nitrate reductase [NADH] 1-like isoform X5 n=1 Tax=Leguminivora glycinivorella TaxID=1035111 RepID=UPI00200D51FB|nr:nitrate reductase [NADH] 1-like isoform X5 [Leguminivora glycinivorella]